MVDDLELMRLHVETLFRHDDNGRLARVNEPDGKPAPRFFLGRTPRGRAWWVRADVDDQLLRELDAACRDEPPGEEFLLPPYGAARYEDILARAAPIQKTWTGPAFRFPTELPRASGTVLITETNANLLRPWLEPWLGDVPRCQPMLSFVVDDAAVAVCCSGRTTAAADEAAVETATEFRGRGYAAQVVAAWADAVRALGRVALYSTSWQNVASLAVARRLGLVRFGTDVHIT